MSWNSIMKFLLNESNDRSSKHVTLLVHIKFFYYKYLLYYHASAMIGVVNMLLYLFI